MAGDSSVTNPKRALARREQEAEGSAPAKKAAPAKGGMSQSSFSGYDKPRKKDPEGLAKALKKRG